MVIAVVCCSVVWCGVVRFVTVVVVVIVVEAVVFVVLVAVVVAVVAVTALDDHHNLRVVRVTRQARMTLEGNNDIKSGKAQKKRIQKAVVACGVLACA